MRTLILLTVIGVGIGSLASAHGSATGVVKERMERMERFEELVDRIFAMINGELAYDPASVKRAALEIRDGAGSHLTALFPPGTSGPPSEAREEIWRDFEDFEQLATLLGNWSGELAVQADNQPQGNLPRRWEDAEMGPGMMQGGGMMNRSGPVFSAWHVAATCNACHASFRSEE